MRAQRRGVQVNKYACESNVIFMQQGTRQGSSHDLNVLQSTNGGYYLKATLLEGSSVKILEGKSEEQAEQGQMRHQCESSARHRQCGCGLMVEAYQKVSCNPLALITRRWLQVDLKMIRLASTSG